MVCVNQGIGINLTEDTEGSDDDNARPRIFRIRTVPDVLRCNNAAVAVIILGAIPWRSITIIKTAILAVFETNIPAFFAGHRRGRGRRREGIRERHLARCGEMELNKVKP